MAEVSVTAAEGESKLSLCFDVDFCIVVLDFFAE